MSLDFQCLNKLGFKSICMKIKKKPVPSGVYGVISNCSYIKKRIHSLASVLDERYE